MKLLPLILTPDIYLIWNNIDIDNFLEMLLLSRNAFIASTQLMYVCTLNRFRYCHYLDG